MWEVACCTSAVSGSIMFWGNICVNVAGWKIICNTGLVKECINEQTCFPGVIKRNHFPMNTILIADKQELAELANKLFMYTDAQQWPLLLQEVFEDELWFDMSSAGGGAPARMKAVAICDAWKQGFSGLDAVHHQAGHYLISVNGNEASIYAYAMAQHFRKSATKGLTRSFIGSYDLKAVRSTNGWRLSQFKYNLKYIDGNASLE